MSNRDDLLGMLNGRKPDRIPLIFSGFWDEKSIHKFSPPECYDENTYYIPSDDPPRDSFSAQPRTPESRMRAVAMARYADMATIGTGKGGVFPFGHGGPGEIQPRVIERGEDYKILEYEGGHWRKFHYNPHSIHYYHFPVRREEDLERLELPDMRESRRFQDILPDAELFKREGYVPTGNIQGFFSGIHNSFMDFEDTMANLLLEPEFMHRLTERLARMSLDAVEMLLERGVEIINVCDDLGNAAGLLLSPALFRTFFLPWYEELTRVVHTRGAWVHMHSHGNIAPLLPDLAAAGIDMLNPFDWEENPDLPELVKRFGDAFIFCGGVEADMHNKSIQEVRAIIRRACDLSQYAGRGYALMMTGPPEDSPVSTWEAWLQIMTEERDRSA